MGIVDAPKLKAQPFELVRGIIVVGWKPNAVGPYSVHKVRNGLWAEVKVLVRCLDHNGVWPV